MKKIILLAAILMVVVINVFAETGEDVSIINLISNPEQYHGKKGIITGYLNMEFEGNGIYLSKDDYINSIYKNGLWCDIDVEKYSNFNKKYVVMEGIFNAKMTGHMGLWSGSIENLSRVWGPIKGKE
ncbi:MAG: hypothetical protein Q8O36_04660 [Candidatus Omnitrophota bacterium]|nr:hypothetical protein [Candidatus Omnitrophota bacterium]